MQEHQLAADRVDRDVHAAVVVVVGGSQAASDHPRRCSEPDCPGGVCELPRPAVRGQVLEDLNGLGARLQANHGDRAVREHEIEVAVEVEIDP